MTLLRLLPPILVLAALAGCTSPSPDTTAHPDLAGPASGGDGADMTPPDAPSAAPGITVTPPSGNSTNKHGLPVTFTVVLDAPPAADVTLPVFTDKPGVAVATPAQLVFTAKNWNAPQTVSVTGVQNHRLDGAQSFTVVLSRAFSDDHAYDGIDPVDFTLVRLDDDAAGLVLTPTDGLMTTAAGGSATFTVQLLTQPAAPVTLSVTSDHPAVGTVAPAQLVFTPGAWDKPQTVTVTGVVSHVADGDHDYGAVLAVADTTDVDYKAIDPATVKVHNVNANRAGISVTPTSGLVTHQNDYYGATGFDVVLTSQPTANVTVYATSGDTAHGGTVSPGILTFTATSWSTSQRVYLTGVDDHTVGPDRPYTIYVSASTADPTYAAIDPPDVSVTNVNTNSPGITVQAASALQTTEVGAAATFTITLHSKPAQAVTIPLSSSNPGEGAPDPASIVFQPADWSTARTVTVRGVADNAADGDQPYVVHVGPSTSGDASYQGLTGLDVHVVNLDSAAHFLTTKRVTSNVSYVSSYILSATPELAKVVIQTGYKIFVVDTATGAQTLVNPTTTGADPYETLDGGRISQDGRYVVFGSYGKNLVAGDTNNFEDVFLRDVVAGTTTRISVGPHGEEGNGGSGSPAISADGAFVVYVSGATNLVDGDSDKQVDVFLWERATGTTTRLAPGSAAALSGDGSVVAFVSAASDLVDGDTNGVADEFVLDRASGKVTRVSVSSTGAQATSASSGTPVLSADGRYVLFSSYDGATLGGAGANLFVHDRTAHTTTPVSIDESGHPVQTSCLWSSLAAGGRYVAFTASSGSLPDAVYVYDREARVSKRVYGSWSYLCSPVPTDDFHSVLFTGTATGSNATDIWLGQSN